MKNINIDDFETVIGIEVHAHINSKTKLFSRAPNHFGDSPNTNVDFFDMASPGTLPLINKICVEKAIKTGFALKGDVNKVSVFERKHYFYPDLPSGYQITQLRQPIVSNGYVELESGKKVRIDRIQLEQDAGKNTHDIDIYNSYVDLNRSGCPLMEIVSCPDMSSTEEAVCYIKKLVQLLRSINTSDANLDKGEFRMDVNISINKPGDELGNRVEIKNLNSTRFMIKAINDEVQRQKAVVLSGQIVEQETRLFDVKSGKTSIMRKKENEADYLYFRDPDLMPLVLTDQLIQSIKESLEELPDDKFKRLVDSTGLSEEDIKIIINEDQSVNFIEQVIGKINSIQMKIFFNLFNSFVRNNYDTDEVNLDYFTEITQMVEKDAISSAIAKKVFNHVMNEDLSPNEIVQKYNYIQISDENVIGKAVDDLLVKHPDMVAKYQSGKVSLIGFFTGQLMRECKIKFNPKIANKILIEKLKS